MFAVQNGGWCASSATAEKTFDKYGKSSDCKKDGKGGGWANDVYTIRGLWIFLIGQELVCFPILYLYMSSGIDESNART